MPNTSVRERHAAAVQRLFKKNRSLSPASWVTPNARLYGGTLAPEIHLTNQWQLANEMGSAPSANGETVAAAAASTCGAHVDYGDPSQSCYSMGRRIARHEWAMTAGEKRKLQGQPCLREEQKERRAAVERQQAILCYEMSIPRRRVLGHISQLTAAQMDLCKAVPTARTAERLVQLKGGRWVLQNPYRQQLLGGEPVMTRVMRGEFYEGQRAEKKGINYCQINKRHVNVASDVNRVMRNTRSE